VLSYDPAMASLGIYPKEYESLYKGNTCIIKFTAVLFTISKL
jgi:hypothetical protein